MPTRPRPHADPTPPVGQGAGAAERSGRLVAGLLGFGLALGGCAWGPPPPPEPPTLASLAGRMPQLDAPRRLHTDAAQAAAAYAAYLAGAPKQAPASDRALALRRLADLELALAEERGAASGAALDLRAAIGHYQQHLRAYPDGPERPRVLYQLARAQELAGDPDAALATLSRLVAEHPASEHAAEAQFRRGEALFSAGRYAPAEQAFASVLQAGQGTPFHDRALFMQGWARFKLGLLDEALQAFFALLDRRLDPGHMTNGPSAEGASATAAEGASATTAEGASATTAGGASATTDGGASATTDGASAATGEGRQGPSRAEPSRAERELLDDTFRVVSLALQSLDGAAGIARYTAAAARQAWEPRVYVELAALYLKHERVKDAADTLAAFAQRRPLHAQAPVMLSRVIGIHEAAGFATLALQAKQDFVTRYGAASALRQANPEGWQQAQPLVKTHLDALARHHHALAQQARARMAAGAHGREATAQGVREAVAQAVHWYRAWLEAFPDDAQAPDTRFLLAELLFEDQRWAEAAAEYQQVAYGAADHPRRAEAGYAALLAQARLRSAAPDDGALQRQGAEQGLRFADRFDRDPRAGAVLAAAAEALFKLGDARAPALAERVLQRQPAEPDPPRRVAWAVLAHSAFDAGHFDAAERAYRELLALTPAAAPTRAALDERLAAAVYKQGEAARAAGELHAARAHFERAAALAPAALQATAEYDAAAAMIALGDWADAAHALEAFRRRHPAHPLAAQLPTKLAAAYLALQRWGSAAVEFERIAAAQADDDQAREARWQAAELHTRAGDRAAAMRAWQRYVQAHPLPLEPAVQARDHLATLARAAGDARAALAWTRAVQQADRDGGDARTERTRLLGARATLALAEPVLRRYREVRLVAPLQRQLKLKKASLERALQALAEVGAYGVAEALSAATFHSAALVQDFGQALLRSERPRGLKKAEREQYDVMLEEQAYPFEEKAIALHAANAQRAAQGVVDAWVWRSFDALATLQPARWSRPERGRMARSLAQWEAAPPVDAAGWTALGVARREQGLFGPAREAYERALALQPGHADAQLDLAILHELYLGDGERALALYTELLERAPGGDPTLARWVADLRRRVATPTAALAPSPSATPAAVPPLATPAAVPPSATPAAVPPSATPAAVPPSATPAAVPPLAAAAPDPTRPTQERR